MSSNPESLKGLIGKALLGASVNQDYIQLQFEAGQTLEITSDGGMGYSAGSSYLKWDVTEQAVGIVKD